MPQGVLVVWEWEWETEDTDTSAAASDCSSDYEGENERMHKDTHFNPDIQSTDDDSCSDSDVSYQTHVVTFKCIGTTYHGDAQEALKKVSMIKDQSTVPVELFPERDNPYDSRAIAFKCYVDNSWTRIGYVVREALDSVHAAIAAKRIVYVKFAWAKYMVNWTNSGPGFYAGINIAIKGEWPSVVCNVVVLCNMLSNNHVG